MSNYCEDDWDSGFLQGQIRGLEEALRILHENAWSQFSTRRSIEAAIKELNK